MKSLDEMVEIVDNMNEEAHQNAWDSWSYADEMAEYAEDDDDWSNVEDMRENASVEQSEYFRDAYYDLDEKTKESMKYWVRNNRDFYQMVQVYFGSDEFLHEFESN